MKTIQIDAILFVLLIVYSVGMTAAYLGESLDTACWIQEYERQTEAFSALGNLLEK